MLIIIFLTGLTVLISSHALARKTIQRKRARSVLLGLRKSECCTTPKMSKPIIAAISVRQNHFSFFITSREIEVARIRRNASI